MLFFYGGAILCDPGYRSDTIALTPHLLHVDPLMTYLLGPATYLLFRSIMSKKFKLNRKHILFFIPPILVFIFFTPFYFQNAEAKILLYPLTRSSNIFIQTTCTIINEFIMVWVIFCFSLSFRNTYFLWDKKKKIIRIILILLFLTIVIFISFQFIGNLNQKFLYRINLLISNCIIFLLITLSLRNPDFFRIIRNEISRGKYLHSKIKGLNIKSLIERIHDLMDYEKVFCDDNFSLQKLSNMVQVHPNQLSEIINNEFNQNFTTFINNYRIEAVKKMINSNPKTNILGAAFNCGFKSKSTFNSAFKKFTGMTPSNYRNTI